MKKFIGVLLAVSLLLAGCASGSGGKNPPEPPKPEYVYDGSFSVQSDEIIVTKQRRDELGLRWWADGCIGVVKEDDQYGFFAANGQKSSVTVGTLDNMAQSCETAEMQIHDLKFPYNYASGGPIYKISETEYVMFYHYEYHAGGDATSFYSGYGMAYSSDKGKNFYDCGQIITANLPIEEATYVVEMTGCAFIVKENDLYIYFRDFMKDGFINNLSVAKTNLNALVEKARQKEAPEFFKYYKGEFSEKGLGGKSSYLERNNPLTRWMDVSYNVDLQKFVMVVSSNKAGTNNVQLYLALSDDGINWTKRTLIKDVSGESFYPSIVSDLDNNRTCGEMMNIFYTYSQVGEFNRWDDAVMKKMVIKFNMVIKN